MRPYFGIRESHYYMIEIFGIYITNNIYVPNSVYVCMHACKYEGMYKCVDQFVLLLFVSYMRF